MKMIESIVAGYEVKYRSETKLPKPQKEEESKIIVVVVSMKLFIKK